MSELIKLSDVSFPETASKEHKEIILASKQPPLKGFKSSELIKAIALLIDKAKKMAGEKDSDPKITEAAIEIITEKIKAGGYGNLTAEQIEIAIKKGAAGDFGEYFGVNARTLNLWIKEFYQEQMKYRKAQAAHEQKLKFEAEEKAKSDHFKENQTEYLLKRLRQEYQKKKENPDYKVFDLNNYFYIHLQSAKKIPMQHPRREEFKEKADEILKKELRGEKLRAGDNQKTIIQSWIDNLGKTLEGKPKMKRKYFGIVMDLILNDYLKECAELGLDFENVIS